jgi:predicted transcriptional regulator
MTLNDLPLDDATRLALDALSRRLNRTPEELAARAVRDIVADTTALIAAAERGLADVKAGRTIDGDAMERWLESWGTDDEEEPPPCA